MDSKAKDSTEHVLSMPSLTFSLLLVVDWIQPAALCIQEMVCGLLWRDVFRHYSSPITASATKRSSTMLPFNCCCRPLTVAALGEHLSPMSPRDVRPDRMALCLIVHLYWQRGLGAVEIP